MTWKRCKVSSWVEQSGEESPHRGNIDKKLAEYNDANSPGHRTIRAKGGEPYDVYLLSDSDQLIAGLYGEVYWQAIEIDRLWVDDAFRGKGIGTQLLNKAIDFGRQQKAIYIHLTTFSFQAPDFYRRHGFSIVGEMKDMPPGHSKFWLRKELGQPST
jgi:GNAT superfamily N-acetyltransferase